MTLTIYHGRTLSALNTAVHSRQWTQMFRLPVNLVAGDLIIAHAEQEITNAEPVTNALTGAQLILGSTQNDTIVHDYAHVIAVDSGMNITPPMHHFTQVRGGSLISPDTGLRWVIFTFYWDTDDGLDGTVEVGKGHLDVTIIRGGVLPLP